MSDVVIKAENLTKIYRIYENDLDRLKEALNPFHTRYSKDFYALRDISFEIRRGENVGLIGKNGAGKSTLLKIITGVIAPTGGKLTVNGRIASLLELGAGFNPDMTGVENIYMDGILMGHDQAYMNAKVDDIIAFADIGEFINQPVKTYSSGMFARLAFAVNAFLEPDILIVDEALSVGDAFFQSKCIDKMRNMIDSGVTILFVSHDTNALKNLCQRAFLIDAGKIIMDASAKEVIESYRNMLIEMRRKMGGKQNDEILALIEEARLDLKTGSAKNITVPIDAARINLNREIFLRNAKYERFQNGKASFENIQLLDLDGEIISEVIFGQEVILRMVVKFHEDIDCLGVGYHIRNLTGVDLVYTDSRFNDTKAIFDARRGDIYVVDWKFRVELKQELYDIACVISIPLNENLTDPEMCDFVPCAIQMQVNNPSPYLTLSGGYVHWHNDLKITRLKKSAVKKICACCGSEIGAYEPLPEEYFEQLKSYGVELKDTYEMLSWREYTCPNCGSSDRERAYALVMKKILPNKKLRILEIAPRQCLTDFIKKNFPAADYKTGDLFMDGVDYRLDVTDMKQIADGSVDFFICSHVLEHVADDLKAMRELRRILAKGGSGIIVVPLDLSRTEIDEDPNCTDVGERWRRFGQDDHVRAYSKQGFLQRLNRAGFAVKEYGKEFFGAELMIENGLTDSAVVYVVR